MAASSKFSLRIGMAAFPNPSPPKRRQRTLDNHRSTSTFPSRSSSAHLLPTTITAKGKWLLQDSEIPVMIRNIRALIDIHVTATGRTRPHPRLPFSQQDLVQVVQLPLRAPPETQSKRRPSAFSNVYTPPVSPSTRCMLREEPRP